MTHAQLTYALLTASKNKIGLRELALLCLAQNIDNTQDLVTASGWKMTAVQSRVTKLRDKGMIAKNSTDEARHRRLTLTEKGNAIIAEMLNQPQP